ncbi:protein of unknown function DUF795 [Gottschalkia acidurici 9a]|uniref:tRNA(Met) cytidine acetate ligase n=1 Tax=Gottschalkia acidurici (strain ATCC 7906 / DSM 604 / BCRC 14475 / CIP 104303 / KCTC 5404 / NCIMB 10678 / 9a) TaxID=1128398 RepID=K0B142_GOTA9|nr:nucleotidyltransferase [Gottschalkia acidurici]AFS78665.1 protein of unknown function DUF795 [Gottschalkia acidurici 9a]
MGIVGLIVEYNPFHNGHLHHLLESKKITNSEYSVAIMSGNFLQRGEPALVDKWSRAKMAIDNGVDLVLELPFIYSCQSAEFFSNGAIKILDSLNIIDSICFGSEAGNIDILDDIASVLLSEPKEFSEHLKSNLNKGLSYPKSRSIALTNFFKNNNYINYNEIESVVSNPNNILGIEYIKSLKRLNSKIKPFTLKRISSNYHDKNINGSIASATAIREEFFRSKNLDKIKGTIPNDTYKYLLEFLNINKSFNSVDNFRDILLYLVRTMDYNNICNIMDMEEGLQNRILKAFNNFNDLNHVLKEIGTRRYPLTRIKRILTHILVGLKKDTFNKLNSYGPQYIRVLGASKNGIKILSDIKYKSNLPIITKFSNYNKFNNETLNEMIELDKKSY